MKSYLWMACVAVAAFSLTPAISAQAQDTVAETVRLNYLGAQNVAAQVKTTQDIEQITCDLKTNSVILRGSRKAVDALKEEILKSDVDLPVYLVKMRLVRYQVDKKGKVSETVVMQPNLAGSLNQTAVLSIGADTGRYSVSLTPQYNSAKSVTLTVEVRELGEQGEILHSGKNTRQVNLGESVRITGMTDATNKALRRAVQQGEVVTKAGAYTGYYLEAVPTANTSGGSSKP